MSSTFKIQGRKEYNVQFTDGKIYINGKEWVGNIISSEDGNYIIQTENKLLTFEIIKKSGKNYEVKSGHTSYPLVLEDELDILIKSMGFNSTVGTKNDQVKAPMPGLIVDIRVKPGDKIKKGDILLILEAMKMENTIKAEHDGEIREILIEPKQSVEKNQILIKY